MEKRHYIKDFVEDLNYKKVILYVGNVNLDTLREKLVNDMINHMNQFDHVSKTKFMYIENCDLEYVDSIDWLFKLINDGYNVYNLYYDDKGFYINIEI